MTDQNTFDVAVIGAGPAGSVAAYAAAARGLRVALVDQRSFPRDKSCGDGLGPGGHRLLKRLRLEHVLADAKPISRVSILAPDGTEAHSDVPIVDGESQHGYVVAREILDDRLLRAALDLGAADFTGHKLTDMAGGNDGVHTIALRPGGAREDEPERVLSCRLLVGADGAYSATRRLLGLPSHPGQHTALAMRAYAEVPEDFEPRLTFEFSRDLLPGYGWIFPNGDGTVNLGVGMPVETIRSRGIDVRKRLNAFAERNRGRGLKIGDLRAHRSHHLPTAAHIPALTRPRAALVGDSAAMINPMSGEGIVYAMTSATALVERLPDDLSDSAAVGDALAGYEWWYRATYTKHMRTNQLAARLMSTPMTANWAVRTASKNPEIMAAAVKLLFGLGHVPRRSLVRNFLKAAVIGR